MTEFSTLRGGPPETADGGRIALIGVTQNGRTNPASAQPLTRDSLPLLLTPREAASVIRVTPKASYTMIERGQLPGVIRMGRRRLRIDTRALLHWLDRKCAPSPKA